MLATKANGTLIAGVLANPGADTPPFPHPPEGEVGWLCPSRLSAADRKPVPEKPAPTAPARALGSGGQGDRARLG
jgi:hypothetical protein